MKKRKAISVFFICIAILPFISLICLQIYQQHVRHEMEESLEDDSMQTIVLPESELRWIKAGKEIIYKQQMFDIKSISIENGMATIKGLFDKKEKEILRLLANSSEEKDEWSGLIHIMHSLFFSDEFLHYELAEMRSVFHHIKKVSFLTRTLPAPAQPPWV